MSEVAVRESLVAAGPRDILYAAVVVHRVNAVITNMEGDLVIKIAAAGLLGRRVV